MGSPSRNVQYHPPRLSEDRLNLPQPHSPSLPTHCSGKSGMRPKATVRAKPSAPWLRTRYILIRADGPERQTCHLRRSVQLRPKARGDRSATQEAQAQRKTAPRVRRTERTQARNVFAVCRDSNGWLARPAPRGACWLERKPCGSFIRHRAREHPQAEARLDAYLDATGTAGAQRTRRCSTR